MRRQQVQKRQQQVLVPVQQQVLVQQQVQELRLLLSCRKQPVQQRQRLLPERGTCSFLRSLVIFKKNNFRKLSKEPKPEFKLFLTGERTRALSTQL